MKQSCNKNAIHVYKSYCFTKKAMWFALIQWMRLQQKKRVTNQWLCFSTNWVFHSSAFHTYILGVETSISRSKAEHRAGKILYLCTIILVLHCCNWIAQIRQQIVPLRVRIRNTNCKYEIHTKEMYFVMKKSLKVSVSKLVFLQDWFTPNKISIKGLF